MSQPGLRRIFPNLAKVISHQGAISGIINATQIIHILSIVVHLQAKLIELIGTFRSIFIIFVLFETFLQNERLIY
jgi:hypothetical protein